jgi:hypothetical protein
MDKKKLKRIDLQKMKESEKGLDDLVLPVPV